jgi:hypothetical protein
MMNSLEIILFLMQRKCFFFTVLARLRLTRKRSRALHLLSSTIYGRHVMPFQRLQTKLSKKDGKNENITLSIDLRYEGRCY